MRIPSWNFNLRRKHPSPDTLSEHVDGRLTGRARERLEAHLAACPACRSEFESLQRTVQALRSMPQMAPRRSFVFMAPPDIAPARAARPRRALAPAWAMGAAASVFALVAGIIMTLDAGGALTPAYSPAPPSQSTIARGPETSPSAQDVYSTLSPTAEPGNLAAGNAPEATPTTAAPSKDAGGAVSLAPTPVATPTPEPTAQATLTGSFGGGQTAAAPATPTAVPERSSQPPAIASGLPTPGPSPTVAPLDKGFAPVATPTPAGPTTADNQGGTPAPGATGGLPPDATAVCAGWQGTPGPGTPEPPSDCVYTLSTGEPTATPAPSPEAPVSTEATPCAEATVQACAGPDTSKDIFSGQAPTSAAPEGSEAQPVAAASQPEGSTPWGWRALEGALAAGAIGLAASGFYLWRRMGGATLP